MASLTGKVAWVTGAGSGIGQAEAIARATDASLDLGVPNVAVIIGEGGSGGAIAIATANRVLMLEHSIYSVISPEGAASILWRDTAKAQEAATGMKITADDMMRFGVIDRIVSEPPGGAHRDPAAASLWRLAVRQALTSLMDLGWSINGFDRRHGYRLEAPSPGTSADAR